MMKFITIFIIILTSISTQASGVFEYQRPVWSLGMGGVYTPFPRETDIPTTNAAHLRHVKVMNLELLNLAGGAPGPETVKYFQSLPPITNFNALNSYMGKTIWTGLDAKASLVVPNFGFSLYNNAYAKSYFSNPLVPEWQVDFKNDYGMNLAGAASLGSNLSFGYALKRIDRTGGNKVVDFNTIDQYITTKNTNIILQQFGDKGTGYGVDLSLLYKEEKLNSPIVTVVYKDVGSTAFVKTAGTKAPPHIEQNLILGLGYLLDGSIIDAKAGFEYRHINTKNVQIGQKLHMGAEVSLPLFDLRVGSSQGYGTYGLGLDLWLFRLDIAQYTVEEGFYPGQSPDQRMQVGLTLDMTFDADFSVTSVNGKRRKLKQRR